LAESKKPDIWMPLYVADYQADTAYLTTEQHGAYLLMLMAYWRNGPIPDNNQIIASITRQTPDAWSITRAVLEPFFEVAGGVWVHKRVEQEYDRAKRNRAVAHDRAAKAAAARWGKNDAQAMLQALPKDMLEKCPSPSPTTSQSKATSKAKEPPVFPQVGQASGEPSAPSGGEKPEKRKSVGKKPKPAKTITEWLDDCKANGVQAIGPDDPIRQWADDAGIPDSMMRLAWLVFVDRWKAKKSQKDWPAVFRNAIRDNWLKLWYVDGDNQYRLTTAGIQESRRLEVANG